MIRRFGWSARLRYGNANKLQAVMQIYDWKAGGLAAPLLITKLPGN